MTPATLAYDGACSLCERWARKIGRLSGGRVIIEPRSGLEKVRLTEAGGRVSEGFDVLKRLSAFVPAFMPLWPFLRLPGAGTLGPKAYEKLAVWRFRLSEKLSGR